MPISCRLPATAASISILNTNHYQWIDRKPRVWEGLRDASLQLGALNVVLVETIGGGHK